MNHEIVFKAMWLLIALGNVLFFVVRGSYIFEPSIVSILFDWSTFTTRNMLWPSDLPSEHPHPSCNFPRQVGPGKAGAEPSIFLPKAFVATAIWLSSSLFPNLPNLSPRHQPCDHNQVLRLDLKIILPLLATSTFVFITVAAVSDFSCITQKILSAHVLHKWHLSVKFKSKIKC